MTHALIKSKISMLVQKVKINGHNPAHPLLHGTT